MKTIVTLTRAYYKQIEIVVDNNLLIDKTEEEIATYLMEEYEIPNEEELFDEAIMEGMKIRDEDNEVDTDRFDIYNDDNSQIYGGHL